MNSGYFRIFVFGVPEGILGTTWRDDGYSSVVLHAAHNHKVAGSNPTPRGRGEINHKSMNNPDQGPGPGPGQGPGSGQGPDTRPGSGSTS